MFNYLFIISIVVFGLSHLLSRLKIKEKHRVIIIVGLLILSNSIVVALLNGAITLVNTYARANYARTIERLVDIKSPEEIESIEDLELLKEDCIDLYLEFTQLYNCLDGIKTRENRAEMKRVTYHIIKSLRKCAYVIIGDINTCEVSNSMKPQIFMKYQKIRMELGELSKYGLKNSYFESDICGSKSLEVSFFDDIDGISRIISNIDSLIYEKGDE